MHGQKKKTNNNNKGCHTNSRLYTQHQAYVKQILLYVQSLTPDDGWKDRLKHAQSHSKIKINLIRWCI